MVAVTEPVVVRLSDPMVCVSRDGRTAVEVVTKEGPVVVVEGLALYKMKTTMEIALADAHATTRKGRWARRYARPVKDR